MKVFSILALTLVVLFGAAVSESKAFLFGGFRRQNNVNIINNFGGGGPAFVGGYNRGFVGGARFGGGFYGNPGFVGQRFGGGFYGGPVGAGPCGNNPNFRFGGGFRY